MDDFMEKLLQEVSGETNGLNLEQFLPESQNTSQPVSKQVTSVIQTQNVKHNTTSNTGYSQGIGMKVAFEDVSYLPDAGEDPAVRPLPGVEELVKEAKKAEAYEEKQRNKEKQAAAAPAQTPADPVLSEEDTDRLTEKILNAVRAELEKSNKDAETAIRDVSINVTESLEKIDSLKNAYKIVIGLLIFNIILGIILVLHNFPGVI